MIALWAANQDKDDATQTSEGDVFMPLRGGGLGSWRGMFRRLQDQALALVATAGAVAR